MSPVIGGKERVRQAFAWIASKRLEQESVPLGKLLDEASLRFDLSPLQTEGLMALLQGPDSSPDDLS